MAQCKVLAISPVQINTASLRQQANFKSKFHLTQIFACVFIKSNYSSGFMSSRKLHDGQRRLRVVLVSIYQRNLHRARPQLQCDAAFRPNIEPMNRHFIPRHQRPNRDHLAPSNNYSKSMNVFSLLIFFLFYLHKGLTAINQDGKASRPSKRSSHQRKRPISTG